MSLVYVYGIALGGDPKVSPRGLDDAAVRWVIQNSLAAAVSDVAENEFNEEALNAHVTDMQWLGPRAIAHQVVNQELHEATEALLPLAFGTVFVSDERVTRMLRDEQRALRDKLERVRGCSEWVVTVHRTGEPDPKASPAVRQLNEEIRAASPGRAHLLRNRLADLERDEARRMHAEAADEVVVALRALARDVFVEPLPADAPDKPLVRVSALVERSAEKKFVQQVERLSKGWYAVQLTGPWPAYRFGGLEHAPAAG